MLFQHGFVTASLLHIYDILFTGNPSFLISLFYFILNYSFHEKQFFQLDRSLVRSYEGLNLASQRSWKLRVLSAERCREPTPIFIVVLKNIKEK